MNVTHSVTGAVAGVAVIPLLPAAVHPQGLSSVAFALVAAGAATMPDLDHPESSPSNWLPPFTTLLAIVISVVSGGHRKAAHWLWTAPVAGLLAVLPAILGAKWVAVPVAGFAIGIGLYSARMAGHIEALLAGLAVAGLAVYFDRTTIWWLGVAVTIGYAMHTLGDLVYGGCWIGPGQFAQIAELDTGGLTEIGMTRPLSWGALGVVSAALAIGWGATLHYLGIGAQGTGHVLWVVFHIPGQILQSTSNKA